VIVVDYFEKTLKEREIFSGRIIKVKVADVELSNGGFSQREIVEHPGAVAILAVTDEQKVVLLRQFRKAVEEVLWEIPAGKLEKNEDPLICAKRELQEETGYTAEKWEKLCQFYTSPGFSNEILYLYRAEGLKLGLSNLDQDEFVEVFTLSRKELEELLEQGKIKDAKTLLGLLYFNLKDKTT